MIEICAGFSLLAQCMSVSGGDDDSTFSALRLRSERQIESVQFITDFDSIMIIRFYYNSTDSGLCKNVNLSKRI